MAIDKEKGKKKKDSQRIASSFVTIIVEFALLLSVIFIDLFLYLFCIDIYHRPSYVYTHILVSLFFFSLFEIE